MTDGVQLEKKTAQRLVTMLRDYEGSPQTQMHRRRSVSGGDSGTGTFPFKVFQKDANSVTVLAGNWTKNGHYTSAIETDINSLTNNTHYIIATLSGGSAPVTPTTLTISSTTTQPTSDQYDTVEVLAVVIVAGGVITSLSQRWWGGDLDNYTTLPDSNSSLGAVNFNSLQIITSGIHAGEASLYNFEDLTTRSTDHGKVGYASISDGTSTTLVWDHIVTNTGSACIDSAVSQTVLTSAGSSLSANSLDFGVYNLDVLDGKLNIVSAGTQSAEIDVWDFSGVTWNGDPINSIYLDMDHVDLDDMPSAANADHDGRYFRQTTYANPETVNYYTSGDIRADEFALRNDPTNNYWSSTNTLFTPSASFYVSAGSSGISLFGGGAVRAISTNAGVEINGKTTVTIDSVGDITATPSSGDFNIAAGALEMAGTQVLSTRVTGWGTPTGTGSRSAFASHAAQTITNPPTQQEVQNIDDSLVAATQALHQLIDDALFHGFIGA